jgi:hypothetical protein
MILSKDWGRRTLTRREGKKEKKRRENIKRKNKLNIN